MLLLLVSWPADNQHAAARAQIWTGAAWLRWLAVTNKAGISTDQQLPRAA